MGHSATVSSKGQVVIPAIFRKEFGLKAGKRITFSKENGKLVISVTDWDAIEALCGKYAGIASEEDWMEEKRLEREREDKRLELA